MSVKTPALISALLVLGVVHPCRGAGPEIISQPRHQTNVVGSQAVFYVFASSLKPIFYQWLRNALPLPGATNDVLLLPAVQFSHAGLYSVLVSNELGEIISEKATLTVTPPRPGDVDFSFSPGSGFINGAVSAVAVQPDGKVLVGGSFTMVSGAVRRGVARLNADGTVDHTFMHGLAGLGGDFQGFFNVFNVLSVAFQTDGRVLIAGSFRSVNGVARTNVARLNADGTLDTTFNAGSITAEMSSTVAWIYSVAVQSDGRILIGGWFQTVNGVTRPRIARLNSNGSLDATFSAVLGANVTGDTRLLRVDAIAVQPDGRILIGGGFGSVNGVARTNIARLHPDGSLDITFQNGMSGAGSSSDTGPVHSLALQSDGSMFIAGEFINVNGLFRNRIARLHSDGSLDPLFLHDMTGPNAAVTSIATQPDGKAVISGSFTEVNGSSRNRVARLHANGAVDTSFQEGLSGANASIHSVALQPDGKVLTAGSFTSLNGIARNGLARLQEEGSVDLAFEQAVSGLNGRINAAVLADDKVLVGGSFTSANGIMRNRVARLNRDGSLDISFQNGMAGANGEVRSVVALPDGKVMVGGFFTSLNGVSRNRIARLNSDGSLDSGFDPGSGIAGRVDSLAVQPDGKVIAGGFFNTVNGVSRTHIARLNADGSLDVSFRGLAFDAHTACFTVEVRAIVLQPDGKVLVGGEFSGIDGVTRSRIARLNHDGTLDTSFQNGMSGAGGPFCASVLSMAVQTDGKVLLGGEFTTVNGVTRNGIARLNANGALDTTFNSVSGATGVGSILVQRDGKVLIAGAFTTINGFSRNGLARLNANGTLDTGFNPGSGLSGGSAASMALLSDGRVLAAGNFTSVKDTVRPFVARLWGDISLGIRHLGNEVVLSWPSGAEGYVLQESSGPGAPWNDITHTRQNDGTNYTVTLPVAPMHQFFRAIQP